MEPPAKRIRLSADPRSKADLELQQDRIQSELRLKSRWESIFEKFSHDFTDVGDEIDTKTGEIVVDNGHIRGMMTEQDTGILSPQDTESLIQEPDSDVDEQYEEEEDIRQMFGRRRANMQAHIAAAAIPQQPVLPSQDAIVQHFGADMGLQISQIVSQLQADESRIEPAWRTSGPGSQKDVPKAIPRPRSSGYGGDPAPEIQSIWAPVVVGRPRGRPPKFRHEPEEADWDGDDPCPVMEDGEFPFVEDPFDSDASIYSSNPVWQQQRHPKSLPHRHSPASPAGANAARSGCRNCAKICSHDFCIEIVDRPADQLRHEHIESRRSMYHGPEGLFDGSDPATEPQWCSRVSKDRARGHGIVIPNSDDIEPSSAETCQYFEESLDDAEASGSLEQPSNAPNDDDEITLISTDHQASPKHPQPDPVPPLNSTNWSRLRFDGGVFSQPEIPNSTAVTQVSDVSAPPDDPSVLGSSLFDGYEWDGARSRVTKFREPRRRAFSEHETARNWVVTGSDQVICDSQPDSNLTSSNEAQSSGLEQSRRVVDPVISSQTPRPAAPVVEPTIEDSQPERTKNTPEVAPSSGVASQCTVSTHSQSVPFVHNAAIPPEAVIEDSWPRRDPDQDRTGSQRFNRAEKSKETPISSAIAAGISSSTPTKGTLMRTPLGTFQDRLESHLSSLESPTTMLTSSSRTVNSTGEKSQRKNTQPETVETPSKKEVVTMHSSSRSLRQGSSSTPCSSASQARRCGEAGFRCSRVFCLKCT